MSRGGKWPQPHVTGVGGWGGQGKVQVKHNVKPDHKLLWSGLAMNHPIRVMHLKTHHRRVLCRNRNSCSGCSDRSASSLPVCVGEPAPAPASTSHGSNHSAAPLLRRGLSTAPRQAAGPALPFCRVTEGGAVEGRCLLQLVIRSATSTSQRRPLSTVTN